MSSYLDWKVGDRVVCVDDHGRHYEENGFSYVRQGQTYTIREIFVSGKGKPCILVNEVQNRTANTVVGTREPGFDASRFRKVQPRKTDISIFEAILHGDRVPEDA